MSGSKDSVAWELVVMIFVVLFFVAAGYALIRVWAYPSSPAPLFATALVPTGISALNKLFGAAFLALFGIKAATARELVNPSPTINLFKWAYPVSLVLAAISWGVARCSTDAWVPSFLPELSGTALAILVTYAVAKVWGGTMVRLLSRQ